jgi:hypothetical protein
MPDGSRGTVAGSKGNVAGSKFCVAAEGELQGVATHSVSAAISRSISGLGRPLPVRSAWNALRTQTFTTDGLRAAFETRGKEPHGPRLAFVDFYPDRRCLPDRLLRSRRSGSRKKGLTTPASGHVSGVPFVDTDIAGKVSGRKIEQAVQRVALSKGHVEMGLRCWRRIESEMVRCGDRRREERRRRRRGVRCKRHIDPVV